MIGRDIFLGGEYAQLFNPDGRGNPFRKIYGRKKRDAMEWIGRLEHSGRILDAGGGYGRLSLALAQSTPHTIFLNDISLVMLERALKCAGGSRNITLINADAHHLPFREGSFDAVVGLDLFCHLERPELALSEFWRVLKSQGMMILDSTNNNPLWTLFYPRYLGKNPLNWLRILKSGGIYPGWESIVSHYPKKRFLSLIHQAGFEIVQNLDYGPRICPKWHLAVARKAA
jgi:glycogen(starch) synthase